MNKIPPILLSGPALLASKVTVPQHVVYRSFPNETVVLNLQTGRYHGLNATAGKMLDVLARAESVSDAAATLAASYQQPRETIEADLSALCSSLLERGLIETTAPTPSASRALSGWPRA